MFKNLVLIFISFSDMAKIIAYLKLREKAINLSTEYFLYNNGIYN